MISSLKYDGILFDWDGTLSDSFDLIVEVCRRVIEEQGVQLSHEEMCERLKSLPLREEYEALMSRKLTDEEFQHFRSRHLHYQEALESDYLHLYPDVRETLDSLKALGLKLGIVSNRAIISLRKNLAFYGMSDYFHTIVPPEDAPQPKPDPVHTQVGLDRLKLPASRVLFVGDSEPDLHSGNGAGCDTALVPYTRYESVIKTQPTYKLKNIKELLEIIKKQ
ncbi:putative Pyrophosphatase PpaX [Blattamonas nauphoetae]|uniref:Pyrophosphatase PpaX n=1 Tax=Blattamonas nauphoetae TaxID=2049346 RepID=A0ABQ9YKG9_9EUKA|nr:putative Pyrophosphatase PpaX [Blattamonas nauphoetae]